MATYTNIAYRLTAYAPPSEDPTEATVMTPVGGASHSDQFKVATVDGVAGFKPYLLSVGGPEGELDVKAAKCSVGDWLVVINDVKVGTTESNAIRWLAAFFGNLQGVHRTSGAKVIIEQSRDGLATWQVIFTGRMRKASLRGQQPLAISVRDMTHDWRADVFVGRPHSSITYAGLMPLLPLGVPVQYGLIPPTARLTGAIVPWNTTQGGTTVYRGVQLDATSIARVENEATDAFFKAIGREMPTMSGLAAFKAAMKQYPNFDNRLRAKIKRLDNSNEGLFRVGALTVVEATQGQGITGFIERAKEGLRWRVTAFAIQPLESTDPEYLALPPDNTSINCVIFLDDDISEENPLLIGDVHKETLKRDILDGKFSHLYRQGMTLPSGKAINDVVWSFPHQDADDPAGRSGFTDFIADTSLPVVRYLITDKEEGWEFIQEQLDQPFRTATRIQPDGKAIPIDLRIPTSLPGTTITDDDLADRVIGWELDPDDAVWSVKAKRYAELPDVHGLSLLGQENPIAARLHVRGGHWTAADLLDAGEVDVQVLDLGNVDTGDGELKLDIKGLRSQPGEFRANMSRAAYNDRIIKMFAQHLRPTHGRGTVTITLRCKDVASTTDCQIGDKRLLTVTPQLDPSTHLRGGTRIGLCFGRQRNFEDGSITLKFLDIGSGVASAPSVATPSATSADPHHAIDAAVTLNGSSERAVLHIAVTATSVGSRPADSSELWTLASEVTATGTVTTRRLPSRRRVWVRVRTEAHPQAGLPPKLPSPWAYPGGTGYADTTAYTAPSVLTVPSPGGKHADYTFTPGNLNLATRVYLVTPTSDPLEKIDMLPPGASRGSVYGLVVSTQYKIAVEHDDGLGGDTTQDDETFTTAGSASACPDAGTMTLLIGTS